MTASVVTHAVDDGDRLAPCLCGDWHPMTFYLAAERCATVERIRERLASLNWLTASEYDIRAILDEEAAR